MTVLLQPTSATEQAGFGVGSTEPLAVRLYGEGPAWLMPVVQRLNELLVHDHKDWDSYGAYPVSASAAALVLQVLREVLPMNAEAPWIVPSNLGGFVIAWERDDLALEVLCEPGIPPRVEVCEGDTESMFFVESSRSKAELATWVRAVRASITGE